MGIAAPGAGETTRLPVMLLDDAGAPVTGEAFDAAGMAVEYRKDGDTSWSAFPSFATTNWDEVGHGLYDVILDGDEADEADLLDTPGFFWVYVKTDNTRGDTFVYNADDRTLTAWLGGAKVCTFTVKDGDGNPIGSCPLLLKNSGGQLLVGVNTNTGTGVIVLNLDQADNYAVTLGPLAGYSFPDNDYDVDVGAAAAQSFTLVGTKVAAPSVPPAPGLCTVYCDFRQIEGGEDAGAGDASMDVVGVVARPSGDTVVYSDEVLAAPCDATGRVELYIVRGSKVVILARWPGTPAVGRSQRVTVDVPATGAYDVGADLQLAITS